jgi:hypothetical protein
MGCEVFAHRIDRLAQFPRLGERNYSRWRAIDVTIRHFSPTTRSALITFLIAGPILWLPVLLTFSGQFFQGLAIWYFGAWAWIYSLANPSLWLMNWIPTAIAAIACSFVLRRLAGNSWYMRRRRWTASGIGSVLCGLISGLVYLCCSSLALLIDPGTPAQSAAAASLTSLSPSGAQFAMLWNGVPLVTVIGALLGGWLAWWSYYSNRSVRTERPLESP